jgi:hypothetical protein
MVMSAFIAFEWLSLSIDMAGMRTGHIEGFAV